MYTRINSIPPVSSNFVGMDVRKMMIAFYVCDVSARMKLGEWELPLDLPKANQYCQKVQNHFGKPHFYPEASSCGFGLQSALNVRGILCEVIVPSTIPCRSGDHIRTDRQDAKKLATLNVDGLPTSVCIPDGDQEALRTLMRCQRGC